ncbi:Arginase/deacetylase [Mycena sanguinolenta]|uniref:Arginase/deacetylase n=1 Tax=Mycena sanguinolenta TaxID=230812 RepID=A0A8H6XC23_9AGAR|nr:Arginase/deacetylase [Mycena sanguinolenta]
MASTKMVSWRDKKPPQFGHAMLEYFAFDPGYLNLNNVVEACRAMDVEAETNPDRWMRFTYSPRLTDVRRRIATLIGAKTEGMRSGSERVPWDVDRATQYRMAEGGHHRRVTYGSVVSTAQYLSDTSPHPVISEITQVFPTTPAKIVTQFRDHLRHLARKDGQKVVAIIDAISSVPAIVFPWKEMVQVCKEEGVLSVVDAAHAIGQQTNLELNKADPDFWVSNCHKWLYTKRSCAVLYVPLRNHHLIRSTLPTSAAYVSPSSGNDRKFADLFQWIATIDFVPFLSVGAALDFRQWLGGEEKINAYCRKITIEGSKRLVQILGTTSLDPSGEMTLNMLPLASDLPEAVVIEKTKNKLLLERNIYAMVFFFQDQWWIRCSTQVGDFEKLGKALLEICPEVEQERLDKTVNQRIAEALALSLTQLLSTPTSMNYLLVALYLAILRPPLVCGAGGQPQFPFTEFEAAPQTWLEKYGKQIDQPFSGPLAFSHLPYTRCLEDETELFDIAILGMPFDTGRIQGLGLVLMPFVLAVGVSEKHEVIRCLGETIHMISVAFYHDFDRRRAMNEKFSGVKIVDCGDVPVNPFDNALAVDQMEVAYSTLLSRPTIANSGLKQRLALDGVDHPRIVSLGGDHTIVLPILRALSKKYGPISVIHFDAHLDTWAGYAGGITEQSKVTHGTFFYLAQEEGLMSNTSIHAGIRCKLGGTEDLENDAATGFQLISTDDIDDLGISEIIRRIRERVGSSPVYLSLDIDVIDPGIAPATGTPGETVFVSTFRKTFIIYDPEAGGWTTRELKRIIRGLAGLNFVGADLVEVAPAYDVAEVTAIAAADLVHDFLSMFLSDEPPNSRPRTRRAPASDEL